jgi:hypothetical protein
MRARTSRRSIDPRRPAGASRFVPRTGAKSPMDAAGCAPVPSICSASQGCVWRTKTKVPSPTKRGQCLRPESRSDEAPELARLTMGHDMSGSDILSNARRRLLLLQLRRLFAEIDEAFARNDFEAARYNNREVAELLELINPRANRHDPSRTSGVQLRDASSRGCNPGRRAS